MVESAAANQDGETGEAADLAVFVDRVAAAGSDRLTAAARVQIRRAIGTGCIPPGVRRLAEALAASIDRAPSPRQAPESTDSVVAAMHTHTLVVLEDIDGPGLADAVRQLVGDGKRVVVTGPDQGALDQLRQAVAGPLAGRVLDRLPELSCSDLRELRALLATSTPTRRARAGQDLPAAAELPDPALVAELCRQAGRVPDTGAGGGLVAHLLAELDPNRRAAVTSVARLVDRSLAALPTPAECEWAWRLLSDLVLAQHRPVFDGLLEDTAQALAGVDGGRGGEPVTFAQPPSEHSRHLLRQYRDFLAGGGRCRSYFRSPAQREAQPVLGAVRVGGRVPTTVAEVSRVVEYLELGEWLRRVCTGCVELGLPGPRDDGELRMLHDTLLRVAAAVRAVSALRHDVLFLAADSPLSVPDVDTAATVAAAVLDFERYGCAGEARQRLAELADELAARSPIIARAPEHERACAALRDRDAAEYTAAVDALVAARREQRDEARRGTLLERLGVVAPALAASWSALADRGPTALGLAAFVPMPELLTQLPPADSADVVLVLGAVRLGVEHLLLTAVAPRLVAAVGAGERPGSTPTLLSVLNRAGALVIPGAPAAPSAPVVPITVAQQARAARPAVLGQAGA